MQKRWTVVTPEKTLPSEAFPELHPLAAHFFANREIHAVPEALAFLDPAWVTGIHDPFLFANMESAVARLFRALEVGEKITVHGDYDADGVTGSTVVITTLREIIERMRSSSSVDSYIPHRDKEGYGLHRNTVGILKERGTSLIITVDCGIACVDEIALAKGQGVDTIVLDHHQFGETLPDGFLIHPRLPGESYPFPHLAAVGVSWKFACALLSEARKRGLDIPSGWEKWLLDLVSIATVTDMVPLVGENRVLMRYGLMVLNKTRRVGLKSLISVSGKNMGELDSESIGFSLGPRINAAGRMDHAMVALELMLAKTEEDADRLSKDIEGHNRQRQKTVERMMKEAETMLEAQMMQSVLVFWNDSWSPALVGLIAGKYMERTGKPCVGIGKHGEAWIGSGRSPTLSYDITEAMRRAGEGILTRVGGHPQACGFSFKEDEQVAQLIGRLQQDAATHLVAEDLIPELRVEAEIRLEDLDWRLIETLEKFEPYGMGNPRPLFVSRHLQVEDVGLVGQQGNHLRCTLRSPQGRAQKFIAFKQGDRLPDCAIGTHLDVVYDVGVNEWNGRREIQCKIVDFRVSA